MWKYLNRGISTPIAITIILILTIAVGSFTWWQYEEIRGFRVRHLELEGLYEREDFDWETYRNEEYGFKVRYPKGWVVKENNEINFGEEKNINGMEVFNTGFTVKYYQDESSFWGDVDDFSSFEDWVNSSFNDLKEGESVESIKFGEGEYVGFLVKKYKGVGVTAIIPSVLVQRKESIYEIVGLIPSSYSRGFQAESEYNYEEVFNQMLSTFKFIEKDEDALGKEEITGFEECVAAGYPTSSEPYLHRSYNAIYCKTDKDSFVKFDKCITNEDCIFLGTENDRNCGCFNKGFQWESWGKGSCDNSVYCRCVNGFCGPTDKLEDKGYGYIIKIYTEEEEEYLDINYVDRIICDGEHSTCFAPNVVSILDENSKIRSFKISGDVEVGIEEAAQYREIEYEELKEMLNKDPEMFNPFMVYFNKQEVVTKIEEWYLP